MYGLVFSAHQSTEPGNEFVSDEREHACSIDEWVGALVDESNYYQRVMQGCGTQRLYATHVGNGHRLERHPADNEARNDDYDRLDDVLLHLVYRLGLTGCSSCRC